MIVSLIILLESVNYKFFIIFCQCVSPKNADVLLDFDLDKFQALGFRVVGLTHAGRNRIGDGNSIQNPSGFTKAGRKLIKQIEARGLSIDVAHLAEPCFWELMDCFSGTLLTSHTGFRQFCDLPRNLSEAQLDILVERGGMIGFTVAPEMLSMANKVDIHDVFAQMDWFVQKYGVDNLGIGSDFGGCELESITDYTQFDLLMDLFVQHGYSFSAIEKIMATNWLNFYEHQYAVGT